MVRQRTGDYIKALLTGMAAGSGQRSKSKTLAEFLTAPIPKGATAPAPIMALGQRRLGSVLDPSTGKVLGLGPENEAPPTLSATTRHPVGSGVTLKDINKAAIAAIGAQYDPAIGTISHQIHHTRKEGRQEKRQIKRRGNQAVGDLAVLYGKLGKYTDREKGRQNNAYKRSIKSTRQGYRDLNKQTSSDFDASTGATAAELKRLGIDPAVALQGAAKDRAFVTAENRRDRRNQVQNIRSSKRGTNILMNRLHNDVLGTGLAAIGQSKAQTEAGIEDAAKQIADQVFQLRMQRSSLEGQRSAALAGQHANFLQQKYTSKADRQSAKLDNLYKRAQIAHLLNQGAGGSSADIGAIGNLGKGLSFLSQNPAKHTAGLENLLEYVTGGHTFSDPNKRSYQWRKEDVGPIWEAMKRTGARHKWTTQEMNYLRRAVEISLGL